MSLQFLVSIEQIIQRYIESTLDPIYLSWFNQCKSIPYKTMMETSKPEYFLAANPGECKPGQ